MDWHCYVHMSYIQKRNCGLHGLFLWTYDLWCMIFDAFAEFEFGFAQKLCLLASNNVLCHSQCLPIKVKLNILFSLPCMNKNELLFFGFFLFISNCQCQFPCAYLSYIHIEVSYHQTQNISDVHWIVIFNFAMFFPEMKSFWYQHSNIVLIFVLIFISIYSFEILNQLFKLRILLSRRRR